MAIDTDDAIFKFGTQDEVTSGTPATIANDAYGPADQGASVNWTNTDDAPLGAAVLKCAFATMPTVGQVELYARLLDIQGTNDVGVPDASNPVVFIGRFQIDFGVSNATNFYTAIPLFRMPGIITAQPIDWYLKNAGTSQTLSVSWQLWITPITEGPAA